MGSDGVKWTREEDCAWIKAGVEGQLGMSDEKYTEGSQLSDGLGMGENRWGHKSLWDGGRSLW